MSILLLLFAGCGSSCELDAPLDYSDDAHWTCKPGLERSCAATIPVRTVETDGTVSSSEIVRATDAPLACFGIYPTLDLRVGAGLHHDTEDVAGPERWSSIYGGRISEICDVYIPIYRQVLLGTYLGKQTAKKDQCIESSFEDIDAAFSAFLAAEPDRPFVLFGHSQGGQHVSRLVRDRVQSDPALLARMVAAYPLGWPLGTAPNSSTGGSFESVPVCTDANQQGCVVGFRTFLAGDDPPEPERFLEGEHGVCVNPASPDDPTATATLSAFVLQAGNGLIDAPPDTPSNALVRYPGRFEAKCVGESTEKTLEVRFIGDGEPPFDLDAGSVHSTNGSHQIDLGFGFEDVIHDVQRRTSGP